MAFTFPFLYYLYPKSVSKSSIMCKVDKIWFVPNVARSFFILKGKNPRLALIVAMGEVHPVKTDPLINQVLMMMARVLLQPPLLVG